MIKQEVMRLLKTPLYWGIVSTAILVRLILGYLDKLYRPEQYWGVSADFWNIIGVTSMAILVLISLISLFSIDYECDTVDIIASTVRGRKRLFISRLITASALVGSSVFLLAAGNVIITLMLGRGMPAQPDWFWRFFTSTGVALCGSLGLSLIACMVCDISKSQPTAICICGVPFIISLFVNTSVIKPLELFWFLRYGFFTEMMRGRLLQSMPRVWGFWYGFMIVCITALAVKKRKERKLL